MKKIKRYTCLLPLAFVALLFCSGALHAQDFEVHFINLGHGDCSLIKTSGGSNILIDAGLAVMSGKLKRYLKRHEVKSIDLLILTHPHADHYGGMKEVIKNFEVKEFVDPGIPSARKAMRSLREALRAKNIPRTIARRGKQFKLGVVTLDVLWPPEKLVENVRSFKNANSIVLRLSYRDVNVLFTGDIESESEKLLVESGIDLASDILKVPHHGVSTSSTRKFLDAVRPRFAVITCGFYAEPSRDLYDTFQERQIKWFRNDANGSVVFRYRKTWPGKFLVDSERGRQNPRLKIAPDWYKLLRQLKTIPRKAKKLLKKKKKQLKSRPHINPALPVGI